MNEEDTTEFKTKVIGKEGTEEGNDLEEIQKQRDRRQSNQYTNSARVARKVEKQRTWKE